MQPMAAVQQIGHRVIKKMPIVMAKNPDLVVVIIDLEHREDCPPHFASAIEEEIVSRLHHPVVKISVVVKVRCFENWLLAGVQSMNSLKGFKVSNKLMNRIIPDKADNVDAIRLLKAVSAGGYDKISDGKRITTCVRCQEIATNSRSFRRCLRVVGAPKYQSQSKTPVIA